MKRLLLLLSALALCAGMLIYGLPAKADKPYDNGGLDGVYYFVTTEVRAGDHPNGI